MNVFNFDPKAVEEERRKLELLEVIETLRNEVQEGNIKEFVACSMGDEGNCQIHVAALDLPGSLGLFEIGKHILLTGDQSDFED